MRFAALFICLIFLTAPVLAAPPDVLPDGGSDTVRAVMDGDSFRLTGGGPDVRFVAIQAPKLPKGRKGFKAWPYGEEARKALEDMVRGHRVTLRLAETPRDRNGRTLAHVVRDDGLWLQLELVRLGWARVYTFPDNRQFARELLGAEREARTAKRGLWRDVTYDVRKADPAALSKDIGTFQIIEGRVANAAKVRGRIYLNFGDDFKTDFTAAIPPDVVPMFTKAKLDPLSLKDKTVRVRGYVRSYNGPSVDISHPEQVEVEP